jgi:MFS family permease
MSDLGTQVSAIAYPLLILAVTHSAAQAGVVGSATIAGTLLMLLPAGVVADRYRRKRIMVISSLVQLVAGATVVPAVLTHHVYLAHLAAVGFAQGAAFAFYVGASRGAVRRIVAPEQLPDAMARTQIRDRTAMLLGPPAGGTLFGIAQYLPFAVDSVSFGAIAAAAALLRKPLDPEDGPAAAREPLRRRVSHGMRYVFASQYLRMVVIWAAAVNAVIAGVRLTTIVLAQHRGATSAEIGLMFSISAACGLAGALLSLRLIKLAGEHGLTLATSWIFPICAVGIAYAPSIWLIAVLAGVTGLAIMPMNVALLSHATRITPDNLQAQTGNAMQLCWTSLSWATPAIFGALTDRLGARTTILIAAGLYLVVAVWLQRNPGVRLLDRRSSATAASPSAASS